MPLNAFQTSYISICPFTVLYGVPTIIALHINKMEIQVLWSSSATLISWLDKKVLSTGVVQDRPTGVYSEELCAIVQLCRSRNMKCRGY